MATDKDKCDLLIVIGSSLKVRPVAHIPSSIPASVPQILINREQLHHLKFDVELLGDSDVIINQICHRLSGSAPQTDDNDWRQLCCDDNVLQESKDLLPPADYLHHHLHHHHHHHRHCSSESEQQSQLDTDTQSLKSNGSADYMLGSSAGTCSDSGFESSTFTAVQSKRPQQTTTQLTTTITNADDRAAIERIKSDILVELNETALSYDRIVAPAAINGSAIASSTASYRHLSIDSSKDSGIEQGEFSNASNNEVISSSASHANVVLETKTAAPSLTPTPPPRKRQATAERLQPGTFYCHGKNSSYVFPGAQVFWNNDFSDDEDEDDDDLVSGRGGDIFGNVVVSDEEACDLNAVPLSPLLPPSLEAHIVTEITSGVTSVATACGSNISPSNKRRTSEEIVESATVAKDKGNAPEIECETPPIKKRRSSSGAATITEATVAATTSSTSAATALTTV